MGTIKLKNIRTFSYHGCLVEESKIINNRFKIIAEGKNLKTKKGKKQLASDLVNESIYLTEQGFSPQLINEDLFDFVKSLFPKGAADPVMEMTKEYAVEWLFKQLNLDPKGWLGTMVSTTIGNIDIADVPKLWSDCSYVTGLLSESIVEGGIKKIQGNYLSTSSDPGLQGMIYDTMRNTIMEALKATDFAQQLQSKLSEVICPLIGKLGTKVSDATEAIKNKALGVES
jgi:dihydroneopterin aldolase